MIREMSPAAVEALLEREFVGHLGCHADGTTYVVPIHYAYERGRIYGHTVVGTKVRMMRKNPNVCLAVSHVNGIFDWESVIAWGTFRELTGDEAEHALQVFMLQLRRTVAVQDQSGPMTLEESVLRKPYIEGREPVIYTIEITHSTGRCEAR